MNHYESASEFSTALSANFANCKWHPHPRYSVFTQYDKPYYLHRRAEFVQKYRTFWAVAKTLNPRSILELGTMAGSAGDAFMSAVNGVRYTGIDVFCPHVSEDGSRWLPLIIAKKLFRERGFKNWQLIQRDLRQLDALPHAADLVFVDASDDPEAKFKDLTLSQTAVPEYILVDDAGDGPKPTPVLDRFLKENAPGIAYSKKLEYTGGGMVIKLKKLYDAVFNGARKLWLRQANSMDRGILRSILDKNIYRLPDRFGDSDIIIDVGAHVGSFSYACLRRAAAKVYAFEPAVENYAICSRNLEAFGDRAIASRVAVWRSDTSVHELRFTGYSCTHEETNYGGGNVIFPGGAQISTPCESLDSILSGFRRVRLLKLDCEGSEWPILFTSRLLESVCEIVGEFHELGGCNGKELIPDGARVNGCSRYNARALIRFLGRHGFRTEVRKEPNCNLGLFFATRAVA